MKNLIAILLFVVMASLAMSQTNSLQSPSWAKDLIIYEIATKSFTSPNGAGSGTFASTQEKLPYLADLGINGIWLSGHNWADNDHFYGIWTQYATIRPDSIDPSLGTRNDLKNLAAACHQKGIKLFLDIITHGVMTESPLVTEHPQWFKGGSWGMADYDWNGKHKDLDLWWVKTHVYYVINEGVDGFRLDVDIYRPDLWQEIKRQCAAAGHPIVVFLENGKNTDNTSDFFQRATMLSIQTKGVDSSLLLISNTAQFFKNLTNGISDYSVDIYYHDGTHSFGSTAMQGELKVVKVFDPQIKPSKEKLKVDKEENYIDLKIEGIDSTRRITFTSVTSKGNNWQLGSPADLWTRMKIGSTMHIYLQPTVPEIAFTSVQLSSHDDGWESFPKTDNPYVAEGSRCLFAYSCLFTPAIPLFMSGEEFNAEYIPLPAHTPDLYGKQKSEKGKWLYGSLIDWNQINQKEHADMLNDVKKMIRIRKENSDLICAATPDKMPNIMTLDSKSDLPVPKPFMIWNDKKVLLIAGNNTDKDLDISIQIPIKDIGLDLNKTYTVRDIWNNKNQKIKASELTNYQLKIKRDKVADGGIGIIEILK
jgi:hypothetical protein